MIKSLFISNYALIHELSVEFSNGLVIITGETGAGKSIIIDALGLILGERASTEVVRTGTDKAVVEGIFQTAGNVRLSIPLEESGIEPADELIIRREVSAKGQSRCFINDSPVTLTLQKHVGELLVDLHGQHEHQSLLRVETHISMLDEFGGLGRMVGEFHEAFKKLQELADKLHELRLREQQLREKKEFYEFQIREINAVAPEPTEEERHERDLRILENAEKLYETTNSLYEVLYEGDRSIHDLLVLVRNRLHDLIEIDTRFHDAAGESSSAVAIVSELAKFIQGYNAGVEFNPERLDELRTRLGRLSMLKKKYGGSVDSIIDYREKIRQEVALAENFDAIIQQLSGELEEVRAECAARAQRLSAKRHEIARKIDHAIVAELAKLGIQNAQFTTHITQKEAPEDGRSDGMANPHRVRQGKHSVCLNPRGYDEVEFYISTNLGEEEKPLAKVASGGEVSRIMLALKTILAKSDRLPVLIFDEIDAGVSGRIAQTVGLSLKSLSSFHQVIAITHLPQIAGLADCHFAVYKSKHGSRTTTTMRKLSLEERIHEVATLMSGAEVTTAGMEGAKELMGLK